MPTNKPRTARGDHRQARATAGLGSPRELAGPPERVLVEIPSASHTFGTGFGGPTTTCIARITSAVTEWIDRQLPVARI
jgi:hypothetical protein